jgi:hypothetical protein
MTTSESDIQTAVSMADLDAASAYLQDIRTSGMAELPPLPLAMSTSIGRQLIRENAKAHPLMAETRGHPHGVSAR